MKGWYNLAQSCNKNTSPEKMIHVNWKKQGWRLLENGAQWLVHKLINLNQFDAHVRTIFFLTTIGFFAFWYNGKQFGAKDNRDPKVQKLFLSLLQRTIGEEQHIYITNHFIPPPHLRAGIFSTWSPISECWTARNSLVNDKNMFE